jgi:hypothetical protein
MQSIGSIKARFPSPYYQEEDVNKLRGHREMRISKPISDRGMSCWPRNVVLPDTERG